MSTQPCHWWVNFTSFYFAVLVQKKSLLVTSHACQLAAPIVVDLFATSKVAKNGSFRFVPVNHFLICYFAPITHQLKIAEMRFKSASHESFFQAKHNPYN